MNPDSHHGTGWLSGTRWKPLVREFAGTLSREMRIMFTPVTVPEKWIFVVGCYNSGTELLMKLLGTNPRISSLPEEGQFLTDQFEPDYVLGLPRMWVMREDLFRLNENDAGPDPVRLKKEWLMRLDRSRSMFLEKSPPNAARTRWLQHHFENAHFICIVRNGYAVADGIRRKAEPRHLSGGWPIEMCAKQWERSNEVLLEDSAYLKNVIWTRYEDIAENPAQETARLLNFLGAEGGVELGRSFAVHEKDEPIRNMNDESIRRLSAEDRAIITREAEPMLRHFGYEIL